jgi:hypothetical protein
MLVLGTGMLTTAVRSDVIPVDEFTDCVYRLSTVVATLCRPVAFGNIRR